MKNFSSPRDKRNAYEKKKKEKKRKIVQSKLFILELVEVYGIIVTLQSQTVVVVTSPIDGSEDNVESAICWLWVNNSFFLLSFFFSFFFFIFLRNTVIQICSRESLFAFPFGKYLYDFILVEAKTSAKRHD